MRENRVDVSVIIPTYNHAHFLEDCLASVYRQEKVSFEIIVVDDGSSDHTAQLCKSHAGRIRYVYQQNAGLSAARNTGIRASAGRFVQYLDADDLLAPDCLYHKCSMIEALGPGKLLVSRTRLFSHVRSNGSIARKGHWRLYTSSLNTHLCRLNIAPPHAYFSPRALFDEIGGFDESYKGCEDYDYWLRALGAGYDYHYCGAAEVLYRKHGNSMGQQKARVGIYPFDVLVHQKKHRGDYGPGVSRQLSTADGMLALADGALRTALMIDVTANPEGRRELVKIASFHIENAMQIVQNPQNELTLESLLYIKRIAQLRTRVRGLEDNKLLELIQQLNGDHSSIRGALRNINMLFPFTQYERQALLSTSLKTAFNNVFAPH